MDHQYPTVAKIPVLDTGKFEQWQFRIQQYLQHEHYAPWEVIEFGDSYKVPVNTTDTTTTTTTSGETGTKSGRTVTLTAKYMQKKKNDVKARTTLLLSLPDEHQLRFSKYKTARELYATILKTFGGNEATKKTKKNLLKQQYGNFRAEGSETLEQTFSRLQVIVGQLQFMDVKVEQDDLNQKFLTSLALEWIMHTIVTLQESVELPEAKTEEGETTSDRETLKQEKKGVDGKLAGLLTASKDLDNLLKSQRPSPTVESTSEEDQNRNPSVSENVASPITPKPFIKFVKPKDSQSESKTDKKETSKKPPVKYAEQYRKPNKKPNVRGNQCNWNNLKSHQLGPDFVMKKKACFNCGDFNHLAYEYRKRVRKSFTPKLVAHRLYKPLQRPVRTNINGASPNRTSFNKQAHSYRNRPFHRTSAVRSPYRSTCVPTVNRNFPPVNRKIFNGSRNFPTANRKFSTASRKFPTGSTKSPTADMGMKGKAVKPSACWSWKPLKNLSNKGPKNNNVSVMFKKYTYIDTQGKLKCDNEGEFKNKEMNDFCLQKGIKREFSNARTPQQNGVYERRNKTLIEAARTMLADAKLPVTIWAEAVNTACYVQNRVLVNKSHNKTPYELFNGRSPAIGFIKPFGCHVMILNTLDNLGKFKEKGDEGYFIGYSMSSKAFRVFNKRTKTVKENLHIEFLENKAIKKGTGPNWLFDIDSLTKSMNYVLVVDASINSTNFSGTKDGAGQEVKKDVSTLRYIALPNWGHDDFLESSLSKSQDACNSDVPKSSRNSNPTATSIIPLADQMETLRVESTIPTATLPVLNACFTDSQEPSNILRATTNSDESNGVEADVSNLETSITASPTPTLRIHRDHPKSFTVYQMDVKSAFLYGIINEEVYVMQPPRFQDPEYLTRVYKVEKAMYGLHQAPRAWYGTLLKYLLTNGFQMVLQKEDGIFLSQDKYVGDFLKKFGYSDVRSSNTPIDKENPWGKDGTGKDIDLHLYRSMIGSLMYLTASRPDIMFAVCSCARHQVTPKECHLHAVKRIFRYLKGHPKLGLWYPKDSPFDLVAYSDSDYGGSTQDRKSTAGGLSMPRETLSKEISTSILCLRNLKLQDEEGINSFLDSELFENLTLMGYNISPHQKFTFQKDEPASPLRDVSQGEACPTDFGFIADQDRATIAKSSTLPYDLAPWVTSPAAKEGNEEEVATKNVSSDTEEVRLDEGDVAAERASEDTEEMATVLTTIDAATVLVSGAT
nr:ribonuclease H-like domain-containing protein [Tanacetum cinerariifolium]